MRFISSQTYDFHPKVTIDEEELKVVRSSKILGITIEDSLQWDAHVDNICSKARKRIWVLRRMMNIRLDYEIILDVFKREIRSILEYNLVIFHSGLTDKLSNRIEKNQ